MSDLVIRPPKVVRILGAVATVVMFAIGIRLIVGSRAHPLFVAWTIGAVVIGWINLTQSVRTSGDTVRVRNFALTRDYSRSDIERFVWRNVPVRWWPQWGLRQMGNFVVVEFTTGKTVVLSATVRWPHGEAEVEGFQQALEAWRTAPGAFSRT